MSRNPRDIGREELVCTLAETDYSVRHASRRLDMCPTTLRARLRKYGIRLRVVKPRAERSPTTRERKILEYYERLGIKAQR